MVMEPVLVVRERSKAFTRLDYRLPFRRAFIETAATFCLLKVELTFSTLAASGECCE